MRSFCTRCGDPITLYFAGQRRCFLCERQVKLITQADSTRRTGRGFSIGKDLTDHLPEQQAA